MRIAILGAGKVGTAIARTALEADHDVRIAGSGSPDSIRLLIDVLAPGAIATTAEEAVQGADLVVLSIPVTKHRTLDAAALQGRVVIDAMNYWPDTDGHATEFTDTDQTSSEIVAAHLAGAQLVKTLNHIGYHELESDGKPPSNPNRRALAVVSDHPEAARNVAEFIDSIGYAPVVAGPLALGRELQPGTEMFGTTLTITEMTDILSVAFAAA